MLPTGSDVISSEDKKETILKSARKDLVLPHYVRSVCKTNLRTRLLLDLKQRSTKAELRGDFFYFFLVKSHLLTGFLTHITVLS